MLIFKVELDVDEKYKFLMFRHYIVSDIQKKHQLERNGNTFLTLLFSSSLLSYMLK